MDRSTTANSPFPWRTLLATAPLLAALSACADPAPTYRQAFGFQCETKKSKVAAVMCNKARDPGAAETTRYCYQSLGDTNCFDRPDPDRKSKPQGTPG